MQIHFYKYQGTGNDFILIDNRSLFFLKDTNLIQRLCDRKFGIGADGLMLLENAPGYDFKMVYYNADGKESTMCGNGGRCIAAFSSLLSITNTKGTFLAIDGEHEFEIDNQQVKLKMIDVDNIDIKNNTYVLFTGSPHYVSFIEDIQAIHILEEARKIRYNETYAEHGINVNFVEERNHVLSMRTYERGVEDETLSCGTGTVAVALSVAVRRQLEKSSLPIQTPGGNLTVSFTKKGTKFTDIWLEGPAEFVFEGQLNIN